MFMKKIMIPFFCILLLLSGCSAKNENTKQEEVPEETVTQNEDYTNILKEYAGNYLLTSMTVSGKEYITEDLLQYQESINQFFKMTILEDGSVFIDFVSEQMRGYIDPVGSTVQMGANGIPFTFDNGVMTISNSETDYVYTFEKKDDLSPVVMLYRNDYLVLEDPYLLPWNLIPDENGNSLFLFSMQIWLTEYTYALDDQSEELQDALNLFKENNPLMDLNEGIHYNYSEDEESFLLDVLYVTPTNYHFFRMWCPSSDREKYEDVMIDLISNHTYILEYYQ